MSNLKIFSFFSIILIFSQISTCYSEELLRDSEVERIIYEIAKPIIQFAQLPMNKLKIRLIKSTALNAFVTENMEIYIYTGLIKENIKPNVLAGVIAHEVGHIKGAHLYQRSKKIQESMGETIGIILVSGIASVASGNSDPFLGSVALAAALQERSLLKYNRSQEIQADNFALSALKKVGYPYEGLLDFFKPFRNNEAHLINSYNSTHPSSYERIENIQEYAKSHLLVPNLHFSSQQEKLYRRVIIKIRAYLLEEESMIDHVADNMSEEEKNYAKSIFWYKENSLDKSTIYIKKLLKTNPEDPFYRELFAQTLHAQGKIREALGEMSRAQNILGDNSVINIELASYEIQLSREKTTSAKEREILLNQAIARLILVSDEEDDNNLVFKNLACAYGDKGDNSLANLYLAKEAFLSGNYQNSILFSERAKETAEKDSDTYWELESIIKDSKEKQNDL